jgi:YD repeat-containing protein
VAGIGAATGSSWSLRTTATYQVERVLDCFANETTRQHDEVSALLASQTTKDGETTFLYDATYHLADVTHPDGGSDALEHDDAGRLVAWRNADRHEARWGWDHLGRLGAAIDRTGASVVYEHEEEGALKGLLAPGEVRLWLIRDPRSQAIVEVRAATGSRRASHDALSRIVEVTDEGGATWRFRYDPCGRASQVELPSGLVRAFESDSDGRVTSVRDGVVALRFERDPFGRVLRVDEGDGGPSVHRDAEGRVTMVESEAGDFWELRRDAAGRVKGESGYGDEEVHTFRDHSGRITREMRGEGRTTVARDAMDRPTNVEHGEVERGDESFQRFRWTKAGWLAHAQDADRVLSLERDGEGRVVLEKQGAHWVRSQYDAAGRRVALSSSLGLSMKIERDVLGGALSVECTRRGEVTRFYESHALTG